MKPDPLHLVPQQWLAGSIAIQESGGGEESKGDHQLLDDFFGSLVIIFEPGAFNGVLGVSMDNPICALKTEMLGGWRGESRLDLTI